MDQALEHSEASASKSSHMRIRDWKGLMAEESRKTRFNVFLLLFLAPAALCFVQAGFFCIKISDSAYAYAMTLLAPIACAALLLGKGYGCLEGIAVGAVLLLHSRVMPLDLYENYYVWVINTVVLFAVIGFFTGLFFAIALRRGRKGKLRLLYLGIICFIQSLVASLAFIIAAIVYIVISQAIVLGLEGEEASQSIIQNTLYLFSSFGNPDLQIVIDFLLMFGLCVGALYWMEHVWPKRRQQHVGNMFRKRLFGVIALSFLMLWSISFVAITIGSVDSANKSISEELDNISKHVVAIQEDMKKLAADTAIEALPEESSELVVRSTGFDRLLDGYTPETDGTIAIVDGDTILFSDNPAFPVGAMMSKVLMSDGSTNMAELAEQDYLVQMVYSVAPLEDDYADARMTFETSNREIGYMRVMKAGDMYVFAARPSSMIFADRWTIMMWVGLWAGVLLLLVFFVTTRLLKISVVEPIHRTNESLEIITRGNLEEHVSVNDNIEFSSLSDGINTTVGALRGWIAEAETRMERELTTAKTIQESALPRTFPPFPEIEMFDLYASMNAAKEVGGDFYDFFLIDDKTLGFLIADVSGKGIPGALFMMAAKSELRTFMESGMELSQAVAGANARLCANNDAGMFVTVWAATLEWETGLLTYVNAGHNFPLLRHGSDGPWEWLNQKCGLFLGTFETAKYRQRTLTLEPKDELVLYTDGVNEAFSVNEEEYGNERLEAFLNQHKDLRPRTMVEELRADVALWAQGAEQSDDITILALEYGVAPEVRDSRTYVATIDNVTRAIDFIDAELDKRMCPLKIQHQIDIALEELLVNICRYAYAGQDKSGEMRVSYVYMGNPSSIIVELADQGVPFDPLKREDPVKPTSIGETGIGGLGIFMVKKSMDDITYAYHEGSNVLVFRKEW